MAKVNKKFQSGQISQNLVALAQQFCYLFLVMTFMIRGQTSKRTKISILQLIAKTGHPNSIICLSLKRLLLVVVAFGLQRSTSNHWSQNNICSITLSIINYHSRLTNQGRVFGINVHCPELIL